MFGGFDRDVYTALGDLPMSAIRGYTHLRCECAGCRRIVDVPFRFIRQRFPNIAIDGLTTATLRNAMRCQRCPGHPPPTRVKPWRIVGSGKSRGPQRKAG